ncbi:hypothetical protein [Mesobacterium pallidum]|uniref:hypothetical protein n=1 Tax=Mesobacterium pallidum TaxID=2872037 RepID=UPI001EE31FBC|nr:hypothetical protein [Mesobacterium pallidum]
MAPVTYAYVTAGDFTTMMQAVEADTQLCYLSLPDPATPGIACRGSVTAIPDLLTCYPGHFFDQHYVVPPGTTLTPVPAMRNRAAE